MLKAKHKTGIVFFPAFDWAISPTHPEREERLLYTQDQLFESGVFDVDGISELKPEVASQQDVKRVHFCVPEPNKVMTESHFISAGGATAIGKAVMDKKIDKGFALVRPPGHHAMRVVHGARGFCNVNIEAIMIEYLRQHYNVDRVAIVDTDCHHGDGTQDIYWHDPDTLFISMHQDGRTLYPGSGFIDELGGPTAFGSTINIPLVPNTSEEGFLYALNKVVMPILEDFKPDLIVNSAGQDNHFSDPITNMNFSAIGYAKLTEILNADIAVLEGGYSIESALPYVNLGIVLAMAGLDYNKIKEPTYNFDQIKQTKTITMQNETICNKVFETWQNRKTLKEKVYGPYDESNEFITRSKNIYYDTDNISEVQEETIRNCSNCGGVLKIDSSASNSYADGNSVCAIHIPKKACPKCKELGYKWFDEANNKKYAMKFLQDRTQDIYITK